MRHLLSALAALVIAPLAWLAIALGQAVSTDTFRAGGFDRAGANGALVFSGILLACVGLLIGTVSSLHVSPLGALLAGLAYLGATGFAMADPPGAVRFFATRWPIGDHVVDLLSPIYTGVLPVLGGVLLMAAFSVRRWRRGPRSGPVALVAPTPWQPDPAGARPFPPGDADTLDIRGT